MCLRTRRRRIASLVRAADRGSEELRKIIVEYTFLNGRGVQRTAASRGVKVLSEHETKPDHPADFPQQRIEYFIEEDSEAGRAICSFLGLTPL